MMCKRPIPDGLVEVDVPPGVFIGSIDERLHNLTSECIRYMLVPTSESVASVRSAWGELTETEKELLGFAHLFTLLARFDVIASLARRVGWLEKPVKRWVDRQRRDIIVNRIYHPASSIRVGLFSGRIPRPPHENPKKMLVRA